MSRITTTLMSCVSVASLISIGAITSVAHAQDAGAESERKLSTVTVTATKREQTLQEVPVAVSVLSDEILNSTGTGSVEALTDLTPSLTFNKGSNETNSSLSIRGVGTSVFSAAVEPSVSVVVDEVVMARAGQGFQDLIDVQRVEVLRGPQSTLFGKNASAGVVSVTTRGPSDTLTGAFDTEIAEEDTSYAVRGTVSGPISDTVGFRLSGFTKEYAGHTRNVATGERLDGYESWGIRGKLEAEPTDKLLLSFIAEYRELESTPSMTVLGSDDPAYIAAIAPVVPGVENTAVNINGRNYSLSEQSGVSAKIEYDFDNDFTLTSITAYREWDFENNLDVDGLALEDPEVGNLLTFDLNRGITNLDQFSQEVRLSSPVMGKVDFIVGGFAYFLNADRFFERRLEIALPSFSLAQSAEFFGTVETKNPAVFASGNYYFNDQTSLFGGIRVLNEEISWDAFRDPANVLQPGDFPVGGPLGTYADFNGSIEDTAVVGNIGLRHTFSDLLNGYVSYSRGYKGGAYTVAFGTVPGADPVKPEESDAFEAGLKFVSSDGNLSANFAAFHTEYKNFQAQAQRPGDITFELTNAGVVSTQGLEAEFAASPTDLLDLNIGLAWIDAKIDEFPGAPCYAGQTAAQGCVGGVQDVSGGELPYSPDFRVTFYGRHTVPFESLPFDGYVQASGYWQDEMNFGLSQAPVAQADSRAIINASIGITDKSGRYQASLFVNNVFDEFYVTSITPFNLFGNAVFQTVPRDHQRYAGIRFGANF